MKLVKIQKTVMCITSSKTNISIVFVFKFVLIVIALLLFNSVIIYGDRLPVAISDSWFLFLKGIYLSTDFRRTGAIISESANCASTTTESYAFRTGLRIVYSESLFSTQNCLYDFVGEKLTAPAKLARFIMLLIF